MNLSAFQSGGLNTSVRSCSAAQPFSTLSTGDGFARAAKAVAASARYEVSRPRCSTRYSSANRTSD